MMEIFFFQMLYSFLFVLQTLAVTDDTVLEAHNEDPALVQMRLIDDGGKLMNLLYIISVAFFLLL